MLYIILGDLGSGKTLLLVYFMLKSKRGHLFGNMNSIKIANYRKIEPSEIFNLPSDAIIALDEGYLWLESRAFKSSLNQLLSYFYFEARKLDMDWIITSQLLSPIEIRFRKMAKFIIMCEKFTDIDNLVYFKYKVHTVKTIKTFVMNNETFQKVTKYFDTKEIILPFRNLDNEAKLLRSTNPKLYVKNMVEYTRNIPKGNFTKDKLSLTLMELGISQVFLPDIYAYLKNQS